MTRCAAPSLFAGIASFLSASVGGRFRLIIGFEAPDGKGTAREGASIIEGTGGHALLMPRALPAPLTAFAVRMVMADGAVYLSGDGEALIYLGGRAVDRAHEGAPAGERERTLIDEAVAGYRDDSTVPRALGGWESVGEGMIGAYVDRMSSRIAGLAEGGRTPGSVSIDDTSGILADLLGRLGVPVAEDGAGLTLRVSPDGRRLASSMPEDEVARALEGALTTNPAVPTGPGLYCVDPAFVLDADAISAAACLAVLAER